MRRCPPLFALLLLLCCWGTAYAAEAPKPLSKADAIALTQKVRDVFEAKCLDCHGPELPRPKGKFGYVLDMARMAANPDYIVPGKPEESDLYKMVRDDEMPGDDANVPPLTADEKEMVRKWVEIGAPGELPPNAEAAAAAVITPTVVEAMKPAEPVWRRALRWLGQFHPLSTHFPVALMFVAVFAEGLAWWTKQPSWQHTVRFLVIVAALGAISATCLGWINAYFSSYNKAAGALLWWHRWVGTISSVWALVCASLILINECAEGSPERTRFRGALMAGAALIGLTGFLGAGLIYGLDHYAW